MNVGVLIARLRRWSLLLTAVIWIVAIVIATHSWLAYRASIPRLDGVVAPADGAPPSPEAAQSSAYADALGIPWLVPVTPAEQQKLNALLPLGKPLFYGDLRLWLTRTSDPRLGVFTTATESALETAFSALRPMDLRLEPSDQPIADASRRGGEDVGEPLRQLSAAALMPKGGQLWVISYNRGILQLLHGNRQRAQTELRRAFANLPKINPAYPPGRADDELYNAAVHTAYALGHLYLATSQETSLDENTRDAAAAQAVGMFRHAVLLSVWHWKLTSPAEAIHPAGYYPLPVTGLSTRALRNDLAAMYLSAPRYHYCGAPMAPDVCTHATFSGECDYRDERFCNTDKRIVSDRLKPTYDALLKEFRDQKIAAAEPTLWALQALAEAEAENSGLVADPLAAYNLGLLLIARDQTALAASYLRDMLRDGDTDVAVPAQVTRLGYLSSMLAGEKPLRRTPRAGPDKIEDSRARRAYSEVYRTGGAAPAFPALGTDAPRETAGQIDRWLFIVRYRDLLGRGQFETFEREHRDAMRALDDDFLQRWKKDALGSFVAMAADRYAKARERQDIRQATLIRRFLVDSPYFDRDVLKAHGIDTPFVSIRGGALLKLLGLLLCATCITWFLWFCIRAVRSTFFGWHRHWRTRAHPVSAQPRVEEPQT